MVGSKLCHFGLGEIFSESAPSCSMPKGNEQHRTKPIQWASNIISMASMRAGGIQVCWCEGSGLGVGGGAASRHGYHA